MTHQTCYATLKSTFFMLTLLTLAACSATSLPREPAKLGHSSDWDALTAIINEPGPIVFQKHLSAHWAVDLSGLVNLDHPAAQTAGLFDRTEPIQIYTYSLRHPSAGTFLVDSGISENFRNPKENRELSWLIRKFMDTGSLRIMKTTHQLTEELNTEPAGVLLTHIHIDHILGISDLPAGTPVYVGPGEANVTSIENLATQGSTDRLLKNANQLKEWQFGNGDVIDVFGDASLFAIHSPGHTPGSVVFVARTTNGPELLLGDTCHTAWGWENGVEPGAFSLDQAQNAASLKRLIDLAQAHPSMRVHPGHQSIPAAHLSSSN